jgi:hypothetical protein
MHFADDVSMRVFHEAIYQSLCVQAKERCGVS